MAIRPVVTDGEEETVCFANNDEEKLRYFKGKVFRRIHSLRKEQKYLFPEIFTNDKVTIRSRERWKADWKLEDTSSKGRSE